MIACNPSHGYPGCYTGPPDRWEPPEPEDLGEVFILLKSKNKWLPLEEKVLEAKWDQIWATLDDIAASVWEDRADYCMEETHGF
jgi:hypothetical protein